VRALSTRGNMLCESPRVFRRPIHLRG
jgi:hypothetical protein